MSDLNIYMRKSLFFSVFILGLSALITQIVLLREFLNIAHGNELVIGIILANWLLLSGIGAYLGKYLWKQLSTAVMLQVLVALLPLIIIFLIRILRNMIFLPGEMISFGSIILYSLLLLAPFCLISGMALIVACRLLGKADQVYLADNIGSVIGGLLFTFVLIFFFNSFQVAFFLLAINLTAAFILSISTGNKKLAFSLLAITFLALILLLGKDLNQLTMQKLYPDQQIIHQKESQYGNLVITETSGQFNFYENTIPLFTSDNTITNEETVHYTMAQTYYPRTVLLISGGVSGTTTEILKYNINRIDYIELDQEIIDIGRQYLTSLDDDRINAISTDARRFLKNSDLYDVAIIDLPDPSNAQLNRFYTVEFFKELKLSLVQGGIVSLSITSSENYQTEATKKLNSVIYTTLSKVFDNVIIIPGERNIFIAADKELSYDIPTAIADRRIETEYVNEYYLLGKLTQDRIIDAEKSASLNVKSNTDFFPSAYYLHIRTWLEQSKFNLGILIAAILVLLTLYLYKIKPVPLSIFTTGFAAAGLQLIILIGFQISYGYVYKWIGAIIAMFMAGLAIGAYFENRLRLKKKDLIMLEIGISVFAFILPFILLVMSGLSFVIPLLALLLALLVGLEFPLAARIQNSATIFTADFIGAAAGVFLASLLLPLIGIFGVCFFICALNLVSGFILWRS